MEFNFKDNSQVETLDKVPKQFRSLYAEQDGGGFALQTSDERVGSAVEAITALSQSLADARKEAKDHKAKVMDLSALSDYGSSPEEIKAGFEAKVAELQQQIAGEGDAKLNLEKIKEDLAKAHAKDLGVKDKRIEALQGQLYERLVKQEAVAAIAEQKGDTKLLLPFVQDRVKVLEEDGAFNVFVVDESGDRRYSGATGKPMTIGELVGEMKADNQFGKLFDSEAPSGGGTPPNRVPVNNRTQNENKSSVEKISAGLDSLGKP